VLLGGGAVIAGGLVAAASSVAPSAHASWAAGYLVLVAGVAQILLGLGQWFFSNPKVPTAPWVVELTCWNLGNAAVLVGALVGVEVSIDIGSAALVATLVLFAAATWRTVSERQLLLVGYRALIIVLVLSVPAGVLLGRTLASK